MLHIVYSWKELSSQMNSHGRQKTDILSDTMWNCCPKIGIIYPVCSMPLYNTEQRYCPISKLPWEATWPLIRIETVALLKSKAFSQPYKANVNPLGLKDQKPENIAVMENMCISSNISFQKW